MIIGIDPDLKKSGVAILGDSLVLKTMTFAETVDLFRSQQENIKKVVIEAGWLNKKANFRSTHSKRVDEQISKRVGENHATGKLLVEMAQSLNLNVVEVRPTRKKKDADEFKRITGYVGRTSQEVRDAGMLIWGVK